MIRWETHFAGRSYVARMDGWDAPHVQIVLGKSGWVLHVGTRHFDSLTDDVNTAKNLAELKLSEYLRDMSAALG